MHQGADTSIRCILQSEGGVWLVMAWYWCLLLRLGPPACPTWARTPPPAAQLPQGPGDCQHPGTRCRVSGARRRAGLPPQGRLKFQLSSQALGPGGRERPRARDQDPTGGRQAGAQSQSAWQSPEYRSPLNCSLSPAGGNTQYSCTNEAVAWEFPEAPGVEAQEAAPPSQGRSFTVHFIALLELACEAAGSILRALGAFCHCPMCPGGEGLQNGGAPGRDEGVLVGA